MGWVDPPQAANPATASRQMSLDIVVSGPKAWLFHFGKRKPRGPGLIAVRFSKRLNLLVPESLERVSVVTPRGAVSGLRRARPGHRPGADGRPIPGADTRSRQSPADHGSRARQWMADCGQAIDKAVSPALTGQLLTHIDVSFDDISSSSLVDRESS